MSILSAFFNQGTANLQRRAQAIASDVIAAINTHAELKAAGQDAAAQRIEDAHEAWELALLHSPDAIKNPTQTITAVLLGGSVLGGSEYSAMVAATRDGRALLAARPTQ